jgi:hypothetical protein
MVADICDVRVSFHPAGAAESDDRPRIVAVHQSPGGGRLNDPMRGYVANPKFWQGAAPRAAPQPTASRDAALEIEVARLKGIRARLPTPRATARPRPIASAAMAEAARLVAGAARRRRA